MDKFKEKLRIRNLWMSAVVLLAAVTNFILFFNKDSVPEIPDFTRGFQTGVYLGIELLLVFFIGRNITAMRSERALKKLYISENDERTIMIMQKTGAVGINICIIGLAFAAVIAGFFNQTIFYALLGATIFTALVKGFFKLYYHHKF